MNSKLFVLALTMAAGTTMTAQADVVTSQEALDRVVAQMNVHNASSHRAPMQASSFSLAKVGTISQQTAPSYYVFNRTSGGFVVAPADDAQPAVLALIDEGSYDEANLPDGFKAWLKEVTTCGAAKAPAQAPAASVSPLLDEAMIAWGQEAPYNNDCPKIVYDGYPYAPLAGCAAIAVGQIMRYYQWPYAGEGTKQYDSYIYVQGQEIKTAVNRTLGTYDWRNILGNYQYTAYSKEQAAAVAKFVADVACACEMNFDPKASATTDLMVAKALKNNFGYDKSLQLLDHAYYSTEAWADLLRAELDAGRPVYLSGANVTNTADGDVLSGHAFVCDGYKEDGTFHINWGWNGMANGYFALTALNPQQQGAGGSAGGYSFMSNAIFGIQPDEGGEESPAFLSLYGDYWETQADSENGGYKIYFTVSNPTATDFDGFIGIRVMEGDEMIMHPKQIAWKLGCKAGAYGTLGKGLTNDYFLQHPTARLELVYAHCPGASTADAATQTAMLEGLDDSEWLLVAAREGTPRSLQAFVDAKNNLTFGDKADETYQLRLAGLTSDITPAAGLTVKFTATVTNESDYEYFAPLYLFLYDSAGNQVAYSTYNLHLLPAHATKCFDFNITLPSGYSSFAVAYEDKGYDWTYVPMPLYQNEGSFTTGLFTPVLEPTEVDSGTDTPDPDQPGTGGYIPAAGAKAYYVRNLDSGCYINIVESETKCAVLSHTKEVLYFEPTGQPDCYVIKGHTGLFMGRYETATTSNVWNMSSSVSETWKVEEIETGKFAFRSTSNGTGNSAYIGFDDSDGNRGGILFKDDAAGFAAFRNKNYSSNHGLFALEEVKTEPEGPDAPDTPDEPAFDGTIAAVGDPVPESATGEGGADLSSFPEAGVGYYIKNIDSGCYLNIVTDKNRSCVLSRTPEKFYFKPMLNSYTGETGFYIFTVDDNNHFLGGHWSNGWNMNNTVDMIWYVRRVEKGVYAFIDRGHLDDYFPSSTITATQAAFLGFNDADYGLNPTAYFSNPVGFAAQRGKKLSEHALFSIELEGSTGSNGPIYGDVDENRTVNIADVDALVNILLRKKDVTPEADTDLSRFITIGDLTKLIKYLNNK